MLYGKLKFPSRVLAAVLLSVLSMGLQTVNAAPKKKAAQKVKVACVGNITLILYNFRRCWATSTW